MGLQFQDELAGGTVLVRPALQSPDFVTGVSGWAVMIDGSAEFNDITIRGGTTVQGLILQYNGAPAAGNLTASIAPAAGVDSFGNAYLSGIATYATDGSGLYTQLQPDGDIALGYTSAFANPGLLSAFVSGLTFVTPYTNAAPNDDPLHFTLQPGGTSGVDRGYMQLSTLNGLDISANIFGRLNVSTQEDSTLGLVVDAVATTTADLMSLRVDGTEVAGVDAAGALTAQNMRWGTAQTPAPGAGGGTTTVTVNFATAMPNTPRVVCFPASTVDPGTVTIRGVVDNESTTGFDIRGYRSTNSATNWRYIAISD